MGGIRRRLVGIAAAVLAASVAFPVSASAAGTPGYCPDANGVTVVVDYQELGGGTEIRCAPGDQATGLAALQHAGFVVTGTARWGLAFVCRINGKPTAATEPCINTPPTTAYWSYWSAPNGGTWAFNTAGASGRKPPLGSFEGWSFSLNHPTNPPPPHIAPLRP